MSMTINTNVASLNGQRNLAGSQNKLNNSLQRLSSGLRINSAKDDAAGLAISSRMDSQIRGMNQAARNANDGISLAQTAEGALQESTSILQRIRELAVQSANDTNTASDRSSMQAEVDELTAELQRIAETTQFNGKNLLDGTLEDAVFQVGANAGANQTISFDIQSAKTTSLSQNANLFSAGKQFNSTSMTGALSAGDIQINGANVRATDGTAADAAVAINTAAGSDVASAVNVQQVAFDDITLTGDVTTEVGVTGTPTGGVGATPATARITDLDDGVSASITGVDFTIDGTRLEMDWAAVTSADSTISGWSDINTTDKLATALNAQSGLSAQHDNGTLILETESGQSLEFGPNGALTSSVAVGTIAPVASGGTDATASTADITALSDADAETVTGIDITVGGNAITIDWGDVTAADATLTGWGDVTTGAQLATVLNAQDGLAAEYDSVTSTLSLSSALGKTMELGATEAGALLGTAEVGTNVITQEASDATISELVLTGITDDVALSAGTLNISVDGSPVSLDVSGATDAENLAVLIGADDNLSATYDSIAETLTIQTAAGNPITVHANGALQTVDGLVGLEGGAGTDTVTISNLDDVLAGNVEGFDILMGGTSLTAGSSSTIADTTYANWDSVTTGGQLADALNQIAAAETDADFLATYDAASDILTLSGNNDGNNVVITTGSSFLTATAIGVDGAPTGGAAAVGATATLTISDADADTVNGINIDVNGASVTVDWDAVPTLTGWADVDSGEDLATVLNAQDGLIASYDGTKVNLSTAPGITLEFGTDGALVNDMSEVGTTGAVTLGDVALVGTAGITGLTDDIADGITGTNIEIDGNALEVDFTGTGMTSWSDVNSIANLETLLDAQDDLAASYDSDTGRMTLTTTEGMTLSFSELTPFVGSDEVGTTGVVSGGAATAGEMLITGMEDADAGDINGLDITVGGDTIAINWSATAYTGWDQIDTASKLEDAINDGTNGLLTADYDAPSDTLTLTSAAGDAIVAGDDGAFTYTESTTGTYTLSVNGEDVSVAAGGDDEINASDVVDAINTWSAGGPGDGYGITASVDATTNEITISNETGDAIELTEVVTSVAAGEGFADDVANMAGESHQGQLVLESTEDLSFSGDLSKIGLADEGLKTTTIDQLDISTVAGSTTAISSVDAALQQINEMRGAMGAVQSRFESTINNLQSASENIAAARSRIVDADFASETAELTKAQILQQAGTAMLAQANQLPQAVLSLLQ